MTASEHLPGGPRLGMVQVVTAAVLWGTGGLVVTELHEHHGLGALTTSAWRMLVAAVALVLFVAVTGRLGAVAATLRTHPVRSLAVGVGTAAYQGMYFVAVLSIGVTLATVISLGLAPVIASTWEHLRAGTRPSHLELAVLVSSLSGLVLMTVFAGNAPGPTGSPALGIVLSIGSGATYAATTLVGHRIAGSVDPIALTTCATAAGAVVLAPAFLLAAAKGSPVISTDPGALGLLAYLGVATMALSYGLLYAGLRTTSASAATIATLVEPLSAATLALVLLDERVTWQATVGGVLILCGVLGLRPRAEPEEIVAT
ncbi:MAG: DMT family transporter [Thermoleophilaceae bacterium]